MTKLLDFSSRQAALRTDPNPFARVTLAHLMTRASRRRPPRPWPTAAPPRRCAPRHCRAGTRAGAVAWRRREDVCPSSPGKRPPAAQPIAFRLVKPHKHGPARAICFDLTGAARL
jgi:hypothetical protein